MRVWIDVGDSRAELGNEGITLHIRENNGRRKVRLRVGKATVEWFPGRTSKNTRRLRLREVLEYLEAEGRRR
jgi:hypothetical protein